MGFTDRHSKKIRCKTSYIPVRLCAFPQTFSYERLLSKFDPAIYVLPAPIIWYHNSKINSLQTWKYMKYHWRKNCVLLLQKFILWGGGQKNTSVLKGNTCNNLLHQSPCQVSLCMFFWNLQTGNAGILNFHLFHLKTLFLTQKKLFHNSVK